ncbi:MAG: aromatic amino acid lyase, partial [Chloroflexota bacterium]|nr:aromatic amino acid lyase [Chloroflexota bacterium]
MGIAINGQPLSFADVVAVARHDARVTLGAEACQRMQRTRAYVDAAAAGERPVYGVTTGFGGLAGMLIPAGERVEMQHAILRSHAALVLLGEGQVVGDDGRARPAGPALSAAGIEPIALEAKEGLALINGT